MHPFIKKLKKEFSKYSIPILSLKNQEYQFDFSGGDEFFESFEQDLVKKGNFTAKVKLLKSDSMLKLDFGINTKLKLECDRTLDEYDEDFEIEREYIYKFGQQNEQVSDEIEIITPDTSEINIAQLLYEYIVLEIPVKKIHPSLRDKEDDPWVYLDTDSTDEIKNEVDPRWDALKGISKK